MFLKALNSKEVLEYVDEYSILKFYTPGFEGPGMYYSTLRDNDYNCSMGVRVTDKGWRISDFGRDEYRGMNVFTYLTHYFKLPDTTEGYLSVLDKIVRDFKLPFQRYPKALSIDFNSSNPAIIYGKIFKARESSTISRITRAWGSRAIDYYLWADIYNIPWRTIFPRLEFYDILPCSKVRVNNSTYYSMDYQPMYSYKLEDYFKIYFPLERRKGLKWKNNIPKDLVFGLKQLPEYGDILIIEKSVKDMVITSLLGYPTLSLGSESTFVPEHVWEDLKRRFKRVYIHLDNDLAGYCNGKRFTEKYGANCIYNPKGLPKDSSDFVEEYNLNELNNLLKTLMYGTSNKLQRVSDKSSKRRELVG
jgi:hypothetical protein